MRENLELIESLNSPQKTATTRDDLVSLAQQTLRALTAIGGSPPPEQGIVREDEANRRTGVRYSLSTQSFVTHTHRRSKRPRSGEVGLCGSGSAGVVVPIAAGVLEVKHWASKLNDGHHAQLGASASPTSVAKQGGGDGGAHQV